MAEGLDALADEGLAGIRAERLARRLGVTKGSFYWHFEDLGDYRAALLEYWSNITDAVIEETETLGGSARDKLHGIVKIVSEGRKAGYDLAIRSWARLDVNAERAVRAVDKRRLDHLEALFKQAGFRGRPAIVRARLMHHYQLAEPMVHPDEDEVERRKLIRIRLDLLLGR